MKILNYIVLTLVIIGALNWLLVGLFSFNLVDSIFGELSILSRIIYILVGIFGVTLASLFSAFPTVFISTLAGLALLSTIAGSLANAMSDISTREAAIITFIATAANINLFGIGGAFWGLVLGLISYFILNFKFLIYEKSFFLFSKLHIHLKNHF